MMIHIKWEDEDSSYEVDQDGEFIGDFTELDKAVRFALDVRANADVDADVIIESIEPE